MRDGDFKFIHCPVDPPQLFDLASDPDEMQNLGDPVYAGGLGEGAVGFGKI